MRSFDGYKDFDTDIRREHDGYIMALMRAIRIPPGVLNMTLTITEAEALKALRDETAAANLAETRARRLLIAAETEDRPLYTRQLRAKQYRQAVRAYKVLSQKLSAALAAARG